MSHLGSLFVLKVKVIKVNMVYTDKARVASLGLFEEEKWAGSMKEIWASSRRISEWHDRQNSEFFNTI